MQPEQNNLDDDSHTSETKPTIGNEFEKKQRLIAKKKIHIVILVALIFIAVAAFVGVKNKDYIEDLVNDSNNSTEFREALVEVTKDGFKPAVLVVEPGTQITWLNSDTEPHYIASNPYPDKSDHPDLDSETPLGPGGTYTYKIGEQGDVYNYHDSYNPELNGSIVVE